MTTEECSEGVNNFGLWGSGGIAGGSGGHVVLRGGGGGGEEEEGCLITYREGH